METLTITRISQAKDKTGQNGAYKQVGIQTEEYGDRWYNFNFNSVLPFKVGDKIEVEVTEREWDGKIYYNIKLPKKGTNPYASEDHERLIKIEATVQLILKRLTDKPEIPH